MQLPFFLELRQTQREFCTPKQNENYYKIDLV